MAGTGRRDRRTKRLSLMVSQSTYDKLLAEATRSTEGNVSGLAYMLLQLGLRLWQSGDNIRPEDNEDKSGGMLMIAGLPSNDKR